jgi:hypothetical protein
MVGMGIIGPNVTMFLDFFHEIHSSQKMSTNLVPTDTIIILSAEGAFPSTSKAL